VLLQTKIEYPLSIASGLSVVSLNIKTGTLNEGAYS
jgi:hypothetical protein